MAASPMSLCPLLLATLLLASAGGALAGSSCKEIPDAQWMDQSPTNPSMYGKCSSAMESWLIPQSHWCKFGDLGMWPAGGPPARAKQCLKFGRLTIFRGPIYGSSPAHKAACNAVLRGADDAALIAVSTKYLKTYQGGWAKDTGACNKCMCVRLHGGDAKYNTGLQKDVVSRFMGLTFLGKVCSSSRAGAARRSSAHGALHQRRAAAAPTV